jgi:hypothetical protein
MQAPPLVIDGWPLTPGKGTGTPDDPFTGNVNIPANTETLTPNNIGTGDDNVTVYHNPDYTLPVRDIELYPGETATVYVAIKINGKTYYFALTVTRQAEILPTVRRSITLPSVEGAITNPPAGVHRVGSGSDFVFTLTGARNSAPPVVRTNRADTPADVLVTPNADGTYTVRQDITLSIDFPTANADVAAAKVWSYGHTFLSNEEITRYSIYTPRAMVWRVSMA